MSNVANARLKAKELQKKAAKEAEAKSKEEERRLHAELMEQERLKHEEKLRKDLEFRRQQEQERLRAEHGELKELLDALSEQLKADFQSVTDAEDWLCYMGELKDLEMTDSIIVNTFITTNSFEDVYSTPSVQLLSAIETSCKMIQAVDNRISIVRTSNIGIRTKIPKLTEAFMNLQNYLRSSLELYRFATLRTALKKASGKSGNYEEKSKCECFQLSLWGNLSRSAKFKVFDFGPMEVEFPASVYINDVAVAVMQSQLSFFFDIADGTVDKRDRLYTNNANVYYLESLPQEPRLPSSYMIPTIVEPGAEEPEAKTTEKPSVKPKLLKKKTTHRKKLLKGAASLNDMSKGQKTAMAPISDSLLDSNDNSSKRKPNTFRRASILAAATITLTTKAAAQSSTETSDVVDVSTMCPIGGIFSVRGYRLPPQPIEMGHWTAYPVVKPHLENFNVLQGESNSMEPMNISLKLETDKYLVSEEPTLAFYDPKDCQWRTSYITHVQYEKENKLIKFRLHKFGEFGLFTKLSNQIPYHSWQIKPLGKSHVEFTLRTPMVKLFLEIKEDKIKLKCPGTYEWQQVANISEKWVSLSEMMKLLRSVGIDIFPNSDTPTPEEIQRKSDKTEDKVCRNIAYMASTMSVMQSRWNSSLSADTIVFRSCHPDYMEEIPEEEWPVFMFALNNFRKMNVTDKSSRFKESFDNKFATHISMLHMMKEMLKIESIEDPIKRNSSVFTVTLYKWLSLLHVFSYSL